MCAKGCEKIKKYTCSTPQQPPALVAFAKYQNIEKLTYEILIELVDHIKVYENGNISVKIKRISIRKKSCSLITIRVLY